MADYTNNSYSVRNGRKDISTEKKIKPVVTPVEKPKKKSKKGFADVFLSDDVDSVKSYIFLEVIVPHVKKAISDIVTTGIDMILYGEDGKTSRSSVNASKVSYRKYYDDDRREPRRSQRKAQDKYDPYDIPLKSRGDAQLVIDSMYEILSQYKVVRISEMYELAGIPSDNHTFFNYGWNDIDDYRIIRTIEGDYIIKMPKARPIDLL